MERNGRPVRYYLVKRGKEIIIREATDEEMLALYNKGVRWHDMPFGSRSEAEAARNKIIESGANL